MDDEANVKLSTNRLRFLESRGATGCNKQMTFDGRREAVRHGTVLNLPAASAGGDQTSNPNSHLKEIIVVSHIDDWVGRQHLRTRSHPDRPLQLSLRPRC